MTKLKIVGFALVFLLLLWFYYCYLFSYSIGPLGETGFIIVSVLEMIFYWTLSKIRWWLLIPISFLYILSWLLLIHIVMPGEWRAYLTLNRLVGNIIGGVGVVIAEVVVEIRKCIIRSSQA